jgi:hypothetical protein
MHGKESKVMHNDAVNADTTEGRGSAPDMVLGMPAWALTALAPLIMGLLVTTLALGGMPLNHVVIGAATRFQPSFGLWLCLPAALGAVLVGGAGLGIARGLARWSYTWVYALWVVLTMAMVVMAEDQPVISPVGDLMVGLALLVALAAVTLVAARRGRADALLAGLGFATAFVLANYAAVSVAPFHRLDLALLALPASLVFAGLIAVVMHNGTAAHWLAALLTAILGAALMWVYVYGTKGQWGLTGSLFATRVVQVAAIGLLGPVALAWLLQGLNRVSGALAGT